MNKLIIAAAIVATCAVYSTGAAEASSVNYDQYLKSDESVIVEGNKSVKSFSTNNLYWSGDDHDVATDGASFAVNETRGILGVSGSALGRWILNSAKNFSLDINVGDINSGLRTDETVVGSMFRLIDFGNNPGDRIEFKLYYADGTQVGSLSDIDGRLGGRGKGTLTDLGNGIFQVMLIEGQGSVTPIFSSTIGGPLLSRIEAINYYSHKASTSDYVVFTATRTIEAPARVPVPAAGILLISSVGALGLFRLGNSI